MQDMRVIHTKQEANPFLCIVGCVIHATPYCAPEEKLSKGHRGTVWLALKFGTATFGAAIKLCQASMTSVKAFTRGNSVKNVLPSSALMAALLPCIAQPHTLWLSDLEKQVVLNKYELSFDDASALRPPSFVRELGAAEQLCHPATLAIPLPSLFADPRSVPKSLEGAVLLNFKASVRTLDDDAPGKKKQRRVAKLRDFTAAGLSLKNFGHLIITYVKLLYTFV